MYCVRNITEALAEFRVNAAQDMGDRRGETNVALLGNHSRS